MINNRAEQGSAMIVVLAVLLMAGLIGIASVSTSTTDMSISNNFNQSLESFYLAEAGVEHAYGILRDSINWRVGLSDVELGGGTYSTRVLDSDSIPALGDTLLLLATGYRSGAQSTVALRLLPERPFRWSAFGDKRFDLNGGTTTDSYDSDSGSYGSTVINDFGDVGGNGIIGINGGAVINGDAMTSSSGSMTVQGASVVTGDTSTTAPVTVLSPVTAGDISAAMAASPAPVGLSGGFAYNAGAKSLKVNPGNTLLISSGTYYFSTMDFKGNVQVQPGATVKIYTDGDLQINSTATINTSGAPAQFQVFCKGAKVTINGGAEVRAAIYAPESQFEFNGASDLYGSFIASDIQQNGASRYHYDRALQNLRYGDLERVSWQQL